jgi:hypothetical protein
VGVAGRQRAVALALLAQQLELAQARLQHDLPAVVRGLPAAFADAALAVLPQPRADVVGAPRYRM